MSVPRKKSSYPIRNGEPIRRLAPDISYDSLTAWSGGFAIGNFVELSTDSAEVAALSWRINRSNASRVRSIAVSGRDADGIVATFFGRKLGHYEPLDQGEPLYTTPLSWEPWQWAGYPDLTWVHTNPTRMTLVAEGSSVAGGGLHPIADVRVPSTEVLDVEVAEGRLLVAATALAHTIVTP